MPKVFLICRARLTGRRSTDQATVRGPSTFLAPSRLDLPGTILRSRDLRSRSLPGMTMLSPVIVMPLSEQSISRPSGPRKRQPSRRTRVPCRPCLLQTAQRPLSRHLPRRPADETPGNVVTVRVGHAPDLVLPRLSDALDHRAIFGWSRCLSSEPALAAGLGRNRRGGQLNMMPPSMFTDWPVM
jgi:hypothetical protein